MRRFFVYILLLLLAELIFSLFFLKKRTSDSKAKKIFEEKKVSLILSDLNIKNRRIHYAIAGNSYLPTLIFIHGSPGSWGRYMDYMCDKDLLKKFRIVSIDRPGFGYSNFGDALHLDEQCKLIEAVLSRIENHQPIFLCGHSYSGAVVSKLAANNPDLFTAIIIIAGAIDPAQEKKELWREIMNVKPLQYFIPGVYRPSNSELLLLKHDLDLLAPDLQKIRSNVIFFHGDKDKTVPVENIYYGKRMMINARSIKLETLQTDDHMLPMTHFKELKKLLMNLY